MPKKGRFCPGGSGGGGYVLETPVHAMAVTVGQKKSAGRGGSAGDLQDHGAGDRKIQVAVSPDLVPGGGKSRIGGSGGRVFGAIPQKNRGVNGRDGSGGPAKDRSQGRQMAVGIGYN
jgi:hypothetical protein